MLRSRTPVPSAREQRKATAMKPHDNRRLALTGFSIRAMPYVIWVSWRTAGAAACQFNATIFPDDFEARDTTTASHSEHEDRTSRYFRTRFTSSSTRPLSAPNALLAWQFRTCHRRELRRFFDETHRQHRLPLTSENHPPLPASYSSFNPIPHAARLSLPFVGVCGCVCLVFVIGDRWGHRRESEEGGSIPPAEVDGGGAIGVARNRPCRSVPVGWNDTQWSSTGGDVRAGINIFGRPLPDSVTYLGELVGHRSRVPPESLLLFFLQAIARNKNLDQFRMSL